MVSESFHHGVSLSERSGKFETAPLHGFTGGPALFLSATLEFTTKSLSMKKYPLDFTTIELKNYD
jgi:hypothetical protein